MATTEIESSRWKEFFNQLSRSHRGWLITVEAFGGDFGAQLEARALPFEGVVAELVSGKNWRLELMAGYKPGDHFSHSIDEPQRVWLSSLDETDGEVLGVECADGQRILVRFSTVRNRR
jgi:hypothetical protein